VREASRQTAVPVPGQARVRQDRRELDLRAHIRELLAALPPIKGDPSLTVDIDPYSFL
jgi:hypothetical protein